MPESAANKKPPTKAHGKIHHVFVEGNAQNMITVLLAYKFG